MTRPPRVCMFVEFMHPVMIDGRVSIAGGMPMLRFFHPRLTLGLSALWRADADVYLFRGAALWAGLVHAVARARGRAHPDVVHDPLAALLRNLLPR